MKNNIVDLCTSLKQKIARYEPRTFVAQLCFLSNAHVHHKTDLVKLRSPVRQLMYLLCLYQSLEQKGKERFEPIGEEFEGIVKVLNDIEAAYSLFDDPSTIAGLKQEEIDRLIVTNTTFLNYYLNASLNFMEQDVERTRATFKHFNSYIVECTALNVEDYLSFAFLMIELEHKKYEDYFNRTYDRNDIDLARRFSVKPAELTDDELLHLSYKTENAVLGLGINVKDIYKKMDADKVDRLLAIFSLQPKTNPDYLYYTEDCTYLSKPIILSDGDKVNMLYSKQLYGAVYNHLFEVCQKMDKNGRKVYESRENNLEQKVKDVFEDFFGDQAKIFTNYTVVGNEKDLLVLTDKTAFIIECKANKYRIPFRDPVKAYERIKDDFEKSIGKGAEQAREVEQLFQIGEKFEIKNEKGDILTSINPRKYKNVFTIVVTQERFGQIQCDLGYLLTLEENQTYPWAIYVDDLETFLITLKRKVDYMKELPIFLLAREQLHERLFCYDELEICAYFLFDRSVFIRNCYRPEIFISSPDVNLFFDELYQAGFGFKDEIRLQKKLNAAHPMAEALAIQHKLRPADRIKPYLSSKERRI